MLAYPSIDPVAVHLGSWPVYWYGIMYLLAFVMGWAILALRIHYHPQRYQLSQEQFADALFFVALGVIIGGRLGYMLFYDWPYLREQPLLLLQIWKGGMSFHGGLIGVTLGLGWYAWRNKRSIFELGDFIAPVCAIGLGLGRIGNFINGELWGRVTTVPWAMEFPNGGPFLRHPSQLYEVFLEGFCLFLIVWIYSRRPRPLGAISGMFILWYGIFRFIVEFFREPDPQVGYIWGVATEGQLLSVPLIIAGAALLAWAYRKRKKA